MNVCVYICVYMYVYVYVYVCVCVCVCVMNVIQEVMPLKRSVARQTSPSASDPVIQQQAHRHHAIATFCVSVKPHQATTRRARIQPSPCSTSYDLVLCRSGEAT